MITDIILYANIAIMLLTGWEAVRSDYSAGEVPDAYSIPFVLAAIGTGYLLGRTVEPFLAALIMIAAVVFPDSEVFGQADWLIVGGLLSAFGFGRWLVVILLACVLALCCYAWDSIAARVFRDPRFALSADGKGIVKGRGVRFLPPLCVAAFAGPAVYRAALPALLSACSAFLGIVQ